MSRIESKISKMVENQVHFNDKYALNQNWIRGGCDYVSSMLTESVEILGELKWEWWIDEPSPINLQALQMEVVDVWTSLMSEVARIFNPLTRAETRNILAPANSLQPSLSAATVLAVKVPLVQRTLKDKVFNFTKVLSAYRGQDGSIYDVITAFWELVTFSGMSFDDLYRMYTVKSQIFKLRNENGCENGMYKGIGDYVEGQYLKIWEGATDTEHALQLAYDLDINSPTFKETLYYRLKLKYDLVHADFVTAQ